MIKKLMVFLKSKKRTVDIFEEHLAYLEAGNYVYDETLKYIYLDQKRNSKEARNMFKNDYTISTYNQSFFRMTVLKCIQTFFNIFILKKVETMTAGIKKEFSGTIFFPGATENDFKIFDLKRNKILLIFKESKYLKIKLTNYKYFKSFFQMPKIINYNKSNNTVIEELINFKITEDWVSDDYNLIIADLFKRYRAYFKYIKNHNNYVEKYSIDFYYDIDSDSLMRDFINKNIPIEILELKFPYLKLHGDLWDSNILLDEKNNDVYYIDWEGSKEYIIIYDFFTLMWTDFIINRNIHTYIEKYLRGEYDEYFKKIFDIFDISFQKIYRKEYLNLYFIHYINDRYGVEDSVESEKIYRIYSELLMKASSIVDKNIVEKETIIK